MDAMKTSCQLIRQYDARSAAAIRRTEGEADQYEDMLGTYLVKLGSSDLTAQDSRTSAKILHIIGDFERISDHAVNVVESAEEMKSKGLRFSPEASHEMHVMTGAVGEIMDLALDAYLQDDPALAAKVEPLEQVVDALKEHPALAEGRVYHRAGLRLVRPAHQSGARGRPLLQHRRVRH